MWAMPSEDQNVMNFNNDYKKQFQNPGSLAGFVENSLDEDQSYSDVFIPGVFIPREYHFDFSQPESSSGRLKLSWPGSNWISLNSD